MRSMCEVEVEIMLIACEVEWLVISWRKKEHHHHLGFDLADRRGHLLVGLALIIDKRGMS